MRNYTETQVCQDLSKKSDIRISGKQIQELKRFPAEGGTQSKGDVGIKSRGKIDFLTKHRGFTHFYVNSF